MGRHRSESAPEPGETTGGSRPHAELFWATRGQEPILIGCSCEIGRAHTYAEWIERFQLPDYSSAELAEAGS
jgi:hypothetical protein